MNHERTEGQTEIGKNTVDIVSGGIAGKREDTRSRIALLYVQGFVGIIIISLIGSGVLLWNGKITFQELTAVIVTLSGVLSGTLGFVVGYYFKSSKD